jgi:glycosyltransferase involved in cell wall biosynthesis
MTRPLRILHVMLGRHNGGLEFAYARYAAGLAQHGHELIQCVAENAAILPHIEPYGVIETLPAHGQYDPRIILAARRIITRYRPDVVIAHGKRADRIFTYAQLIFPKTTPHIEVLHRPRFHRLHRADMTITVSDDLRRAFIEHHGESASVETYPNFLLSLPPPSLSPRPLSSPPIIGFIGRFVPEKGLDLLLDAAAFMRAEGVDFRLKIAGDGVLKDVLIAQAERLHLQDCIEWCGWISDNTAFYESIDMLCVPSRAESFGLVVIEALAHSIPVIATRSSGPQSILTHEVTGMLCDINAAAIADALTLLLRSPSRIASLGTHARETAESYSADHIIPAIIECIKRTIVCYNRR